MSDEYDDDSDQETPVSEDIAAKLSAAEKAQRALERKLAQAEEQLTTIRNERIAAKFEGVPEYLADLWKTAHPGQEPGDEDLEKLRVAPANEAIPDTTASTTPTSTYVPVPGGMAPDPSTKKISEAEFDQIMRTDPTRGAALANQVDWSEETLRMTGQKG